VLLQNFGKRERFLTPAYSHRDLCLIRHAPAQPAGFLSGRTDADCYEIEPPVKDRLNQMLTDCEALYSSPAIRCVKTCQAVFPGRSPTHTEAFLEQSFGDWDGLAFGDVPDVGSLQGDELVQFAPPNGESFADLCARVQPALIGLLDTEQARSTAVFTHAGVIRSCLALAFDSPSAALRCEIDPLSVTRLRALPGGQFSVVCVNWVGQDFQLA
jgi:alpha-ribazole phosphatase